MRMRRKKQRNKGEGGSRHQIKRKKEEEGAIIIYCHYKTKPYLKLCYEKNRVSDGETLINNNISRSEFEITII